MSSQEMYDKITKRFGTPERGSITERLYEKLAAIVELEGDRAYSIIASAAADSAGKGSPDRYFAKVAIARLRERGLLPTADGF